MTSTALTGEAIILKVIDALADFKANRIYVSTDVFRVLIKWRTEYIGDKDMLRLLPEKEAHKIADVGFFSDLRLPPGTIVIAKELKI